MTSPVTVFGRPVALPNGRTGIRKIVHENFPAAAALKDADEPGMFGRSDALLMTRLITGSVVTALLCSSLNGCSRGDIMEVISISSAIAGAATVVTIVAVHEATERQRQAAQEQARLAQQLIEQHRTRGLKESRYLAVTTVREPDSKGAKSLMIFDTQTDQVVGNHVYDVKTEPKTGQVGKFETYSAEYVGIGQAKTGE
jgi:hypothetical protein